eukprot:7169808-Karenia_brevis.AAC.1
MVSGKCGAHQAHRVIAIREKQVIGDVHAIAVMGCHVGNQNRLQQALWSLLEDFQYHIGYPNPVYEKLHVEILFRTISRRKNLVSCLAFLKP